MNNIYLDNAATSYPKPKDVLDAMTDYQQSIGGSPGRSGHKRSIDAGRTIYKTREVLANLFQIDDPLNIALLKNATEALNIVLQGGLQPGDHVITSSMEHNSVMRPLRFMESRGVELTVVPCSPEGELDPGDIGKAFKKKTRMIVLTHASNVTGTIMPVEAVGALVREKGDVLFCVDAAQTAGALPIDVEKMSIDLLAFTGHKSLYGPQGTGGLYVRSGLEKRIAPLMMGGTGSRSEFEEQPDFMPDKYESGTPNTIGLAGLGAGVAYVLEQTIEAIRAREEQLTYTFLEQLKEFKDRVTVYGTTDTARRTAVVSFNLKDVSPSDAALYFEDKHGILCRPGLHCAPSAHRTIGTFPQGTIRFSFSFFSTRQDIDEAVGAIRDLLGIAAR
ncbi:MAG: cysteine desulfurase [Deltaproteobacteria bacterium HGW-Deltaproteobacteria-10]|jgi:cysteine desulfurase family protein|nr:MAG: cysteine desulfurase [Deltaproteobacteria bacterium HGW-Deltaproteobacteria-10]